MCVCVVFCGLLERSFPLRSRNSRILHACEQKLFISFATSASFYFDQEDELARFHGLLNIFIWTIFKYLLLLVLLLLA